MDMCLYTLCFFSRIFYPRLSFNIFRQIFYTGPLQNHDMYVCANMISPYSPSFIIVILFSPNALKKGQSQKCILYFLIIFHCYEQMATCIVPSTSSCPNLTDMFLRFLQMGKRKGKSRRKSTGGPENSVNTKPVFISVALYYRVH